MTSHMLFEESLMLTPSKLNSNHYNQIEITEKSMQVERKAAA